MMAPRSPRVKVLLGIAQLTHAQTMEVISILGLSDYNRITYEPLTEDVADHYCPCTRSICPRAGMSCGIPSCGEASHPNDFLTLSRCPKEVS